MLNLHAKTVTKRTTTSRMARTFIDVFQEGESIVRVFEDEGYRTSYNPGITKDVLRSILVNEVNIQFSQAWNDDQVKEAYLAQICKYMVSPDYIAGYWTRAGIWVPGALDRSTIWVRMGQLFADHEETMGFLLAEPIDGDGVYIDVLCAKDRWGKRLMDFFLALAESSNMAFAELSALAHVLAYYPNQFEFAHRNSCASDPNISMPLALQNELKALVLNRDKMYEYILDPEIIHSPRFFAGADMLNEYLLRLAQLGYLAPSSKKCDEEGHTMTFNQLMSNGCFENGFRMRKCFKETATAPMMSVADRTAKKHTMKKAKTKKRAIPKMPRRFSKRLAKRPQSTWTRIQRPINSPYIPKRARTKRNT